MTYARARLWLGITGVGLLVTVSALLLLLGPSLTLPGLLALYLLIHLPLDYLGGAWLPRLFGRSPGPFWLGYLRGALLHAGCLALFAYAILAVGSWGGRPAVFFLQLVLILVCAAAQAPLAQLIGGTEEQDRGFTGGIAGFPGREQVVLPTAWPEDVGQVVSRRRQAACQSGSRTRGWCLAILWNLAGFTASSWLPGAGVTTETELLRTILGFTLWSFLGLLLLPTVSRWGVFEVDQYARRLGLSLSDFTGAVIACDRLQDDEPQRSPGVETIFHPLPGVNERLHRFLQPVSTPPGAWNAARYALFFAWPCLGLLSRAVHCNAGRPELWVFLPVD
ncbi:MAG: hypothetical protein K2X03_05540 [Bryobacteraceae bacterium]|nr:hypothetical protein [Bryobacteraceae bacterium]